MVVLVLLIGATAVLLALLLIALARLALIGHRPTRSDASLLQVATLPSRWRALAPILRRPQGGSEVDIAQTTERPGDESRDTGETAVLDQARPGGDEHEVELWVRERLYGRPGRHS